MNITDVRVRLVEKDDSKLRAFASFTIDNCFVVHDVKVIDGTNGTFIAMPSRLGPNGEHRDIAHALDTATREQIISAVLAAYESAKNAQ